MYTIEQYIRWRGDLSFEVSPINEIDLVLLSQLPYLFLENLIDKNTSISLKKLLQLYYDKFKYQELGLIIPPIILQTLYLASHQNRYQDIVITNFIKVIDETKDEQFCAITMHLTDKISYVVFSGTDDTVIGWKENFNMLIINDTNAQLDALGYINMLYNENHLVNKEIIIGGHSKGGNLAIYAATNASKEIQDQIIKVYNFDGPGFSNDFFSSEKYQNIANKVYEILPIDSVIGCLFYHAETQIIVKSNANGLFQHNVLTWLVERDSFIKINSVSHKANHVDKKIKHLVETMDHDMRKNFIDTLYKLLSINENKLLITLKNHKLAMARTYKNLSKEEKKIILQLLNYLVKDGIIRASLIKSLIELDRFKRRLKAIEKKQNKN